MATLKETHVVTCFLRNRGEVLLLRRSNAVGSYRGKWGTVAGYAEGSPEQAATREIAEETGLADHVELVRQGEPFPVEDKDLAKRWVVHPFLFDCASREFKLDWESAGGEWVSPTEMLHRDTVPQLWTSYQTVAPSVASVNADREHGAAYISIRALEVLRDQAALLAADETADGWETLCRTALDLIDGHPTMAVLANRLNRVMSLSKDSGSAETVAHHAHAAIGTAFADDEAASRQATKLVAGRVVLTLSRSGTVLHALLTAEPKPTKVAVAESHPGGEGVGVAEELMRAGLSVTLLPDADVVPLVEARRVELILIGADSVLPSGEVVNKVGSRDLALAARRAGIPIYAVASTDKLRIGAHDAVIERLFETVPADAVTGIVTERGASKPGELEALAAELKERTDWRS